MSAPEHRVTPRFKLHIPFSFQRMTSASGVEYLARAINISTSGIYFATTVVLCVGDALEVLMEMPKRVTCAQKGLLRFAARVAHIEAKNMPQGFSGIGLQLICFERLSRDCERPAARIAAPGAHGG